VGGAARPLTVITRVVTIDPHVRKINADERTSTDVVKGRYTQRALY